MQSSNYSPTPENASDSFALGVLDEILSSGIRDHVTIFNSDLSDGIEIDCIMQGKAADTYLKSMERNIICHPGTIKSGQYVYDGVQYWIAVGLPDSVYGVYEKCNLLLCQYYLRWQNRDGDIIGRWVNISSASKYDTGQTESDQFIFSSNNYSIIIPSDNETNNIYNKRVFIDSEDIPADVYRITRDDGVLYKYPNIGGCLIFITSKDEFNSETDNIELGICDYIEQNHTSSQIIGDNILYYGVENQYRINNDTNDMTLEIDIQNTSVTYTIQNNIISVLCNNMDDIGKSFVIHLKQDDTIIETFQIEIHNFV